MVHKTFCSCLVLLFVLSAFCSDVLALNSAEIEAVRSRTLQSKSALKNSDLDTIDGFLRQGMDELLLEEDPWRAVNIRNEIIAQRGGAEVSTYATAFIDSAKKNLRIAFTDTARLQDAERRMRMELNLLIIAASLKSPEMAEFGLAKLSSGNGMVRYWAVKTVAGEEVAKQLGSEITGDDELAAKIVAELGKIVDGGTFPETLRLMVDFADQLGSPETTELVTKIADLRMSEYDSWKVKYELLDGVVLLSLANRIASEPSQAAKEELCRKFGQLYSYVIERLVLGENILRQEQKDELASVIVEVEYSGVSKLMGRSDGRLKKAIEDAKLPVLDSQRKFLLGDSTQAGQLPEKLGFDYGKDAGGNVLTGPKSLKAPPAPAVGSDN